MGQIKEIIAPAEGEFTCCDCNETFTDNYQGYHSTERCIDCEAQLIDIGLSAMLAPKN